MLMFSTSTPRSDRVHHITEADIRVLLGRLPAELWSSLRGVHLNDHSRGGRVLGYVNRGRREIAMCALPPRMSLSRFLVRGQTAEQFGATKGAQWPPTAIRRFLLYDVFLHELGHLQVVHERAHTERRKFAMETRAQEFAMKWCATLLAEAFDHPDFVHQAPTATELEDPDPALTDLVRRTVCEPRNGSLFQELGRLHTERGHREEARAAFERAIELEPQDLFNHLFLGNWHYANNDAVPAIEHFTRASELLPNDPAPYWCLADAYQLIGDDKQADSNFRRAVQVDPKSKIARKKLAAWVGRVA